MLALPGSAYLFQGEELGLPEATLLSDGARQDPTWARSGHTSYGRDGCRVPVPWSGGEPSYGFGPGGESWLPQPAEWADLSAERQEAVPESTLELYRTLLHERRGLRLGRGTLTWLEGLPQDVLAFTISAADDRAVLVMANLGTTAISLPADAEVIVSSDDLGDDGTVPTDVTVWADVTTV